VRDPGVVIDDVDDVAVAVDHARLSIGHVALARYALVPIMIAARGRLALDRPGPRVLARTTQLLTNVSDRWWEVSAEFGSQ
jgi:hypothetical protein